MKHISLFLVCIICLPCFVFSQQPESDTVYYYSPVLITATQATERETPATFSNLSRQQIQQRHSLQDISLLLSEMPSMTSYSENGNGIGYSYINLRGFDQRRLSIMINGVPQNDPEDHQVYWIDMPDLPGYSQSIQVQRGAGSAFYGPPAIGGSINIVTSPVTTQPRISLSSGFGFQEFGDENKTRLNERKYSLSVSSGLIDKQYILYGSFSKISSGGYRQQSWVDVNSYFVGISRFDENMTTRVHIYGGPITDALSYVGLPKSYNSNNSLRRANYSFWDTTGYVLSQKPQASENFSQPHYELLNEWKISPATSVYNTLFYIQGEGYFDYDGDWVPNDPVATKWFQNTVGYDSTFGVSKFPTFILRGYVGNKQWGWLPRIEFEHEKGKLTLGAEMRIHRSSHFGTIPFASEYPSSSFNPDFHFYEYNGMRDIFSGYVHSLHKLGDSTTIMTDIQIVYNRYGIHNEKFIGNDFNVSYLFLNPRLGINRNFSETFNGYISVAYTSREPRMRNLYAAEDAFFGAKPQFEAIPSFVGGSKYLFDKPFSKPEHLLDVELGGKYLLEAGRISANVYWMQFQDELVKSGTIDIFGGSVLVNANRTRHMGVELDGEYKLTNEFEVSGNVTFSANRIISHSFFDSSASIVRTLDGNPIAGFPDALGNVRLKYGQKRWFVSLLLKYVGSFYTDNLKDERNKVDAYTVADFDASWKLLSMSNNIDVLISGKIRNLFNKLYLASGEGSAFFPAAERNYYFGLTLSF